MRLFRNIRFYVLLFSIILSAAVSVYIHQTISDETLQNIRSTQYYALIAVTFLYLAVIAGPLTYILPMLPFRAQYMKTRRAIGISAFFFGVLHASFAFFGQLGGFGGLPFLSSKYLLAISLSFTALVILTAMASTSFDFIVAKIGFKKWKMLHRLVYLVVILITIHALMLGTHFADLSALIPQIFTAALAILLLLEANRFDAFLERRFQTSQVEQSNPKPSYALPHYGPTLVIMIMVIVWLVLSTFGASSGGVPSLGIHSLHIQLAKEAQLKATQSVNNIPSYMQGDRTKRFTVSFLHPDVVEASSDAKLQFLINDASSGNPVNFFTKIYEKPMHLIIVDSSLSFFTHIHPEQINGGFNITTQFPKEGVYHLYQDFQPVGAIEQQFAFTLPVVRSLLDLRSLDEGDGESRPVGASSSATLANFEPEIPGVTKQFGDYEISLTYPAPLQSSQISVGNEKLTFTIKDAKTHQGLTNLKPYLAAFGHLVMINQQTFDYIHVHPSNVVAPPPDATIGPEVDFLPLGLYSPIKPGIYRLFAQFNPDGKLFTADFTVKVE